MTPDTELSYSDMRVAKLLQKFPRIKTRGNLRPGGRLRSEPRSYGRKYLVNTDHDQFLSHFLGFSGVDQEQLLSEIKSVLSFAVWRQKSDLSHAEGKSLNQQLQQLSEIFTLLSELSERLESSQLSARVLGMSYVDEQIHSRGPVDSLRFDLPNPSEHFQQFKKEIRIWLDALENLKSDLETNFDEKQQVGEGGDQELWVRDSVFFLANIWVRFSGEKPTTNYNPHETGRNKYSPFIHFCHDCLAVVSPKKTGVSFPRTAVLEVLGHRHVPAFTMFEVAESRGLIISE